MAENMQRLAAPIIEGTVPAFYAQENGTVTLTVPFSMNRAVSKNHIYGFEAKIKNLQGSDFLFPLKTTIDDNNGDDNNGWDFIKNEVYFDIPAAYQQLLVPGQFYKLQLAYIDKNNAVGYYSTVGIVKYTTKPLIKILGLNPSEINIHNYNYVGSYSQFNRDTTEKEYAYRWVLTDYDYNVLHDSGYIVHNNSEDTNEYESINRFIYSQDLQINLIYRLKYYIKTNNGLEVSSQYYRIQQSTSILPDTVEYVLPTLNYDNGYIEVSLKGFIENDGHEKIADGNFIISRSSEDSLYKSWDELVRFSMFNEKPSRFKWKDFTIEQGKKYRYAIQQFNDGGIYSERVYSKEIIADFEDAFLYDGKRQLKIRYNPKVSSFKTSLLESKVNTIGSKHPFIFRNGNVEYKEFPISGLISYHSDEEDLFITKDSLGLTWDVFTREETVRSDITLDNRDYFNIVINEQDKSNYEASYAHREEIEKQLNIARLNNNNNITSENLSAERIFKLEVLDWLNNGEVKLFKSPSEGNYLVRLMNVSLSPTDSLGRMLHTFSATAYEIDDNIFSNLNKYNIIVSDLIEEKQYKGASVSLMTNENKSKDDRYYTENGKIYYARGNLLPSGVVANKVIIKDIKSLKDRDELGLMVTINGEEIYVTPNKNYVFENMEIKSVYIPLDSKAQGLIEYYYWGTLKNSFERIDEVRHVDVFSKQFYSTKDNLITKVQDIKTQIYNVYNLQFFARQIGKSESTWSWKKVDEDIITEDNYYKFYLEKNGRYFQPVSYVDDTDYWTKEYKIGYKPYGQEEEIYPYQQFTLVDGNNAVKKVVLQTAQPMQIYEFYPETILTNRTNYSLYQEVFFANTVETRGTNLDFENKIKNKELYIFENGSFSLVPSTAKLNIEKHYFVIKPIVRYADPLNMDAMILSKETYDSFYEMFTMLDRVNNTNIISSFIREWDYLKYGYEIDGEKFILNKENPYAMISYDIYGQVPKSIHIDFGIACEMSYSVQIIDYSIEKEGSYTQLMECKENYDQYNYNLSQEAMFDLTSPEPGDDNAEILKKETDYIALIENTRKNYKEQYANYMYQIEAGLEKEGLL